MNKLEQIIIQYPHAQTICVIGHPASGKTYLGRELDTETYNIIDCDMYLSEPLPISALLRDFGKLDGSSRTTVLIGNLSTENLEGIAPDLIITVKADPEVIRHVYEKERDLSKLDAATRFWESSLKTAFFYYRDNYVPIAVVLNSDGRARAEMPKAPATTDEIAVTTVTATNLERGVFNAEFFSTVESFTLGSYSIQDRKAAAVMAASYANSISTENVADAENQLKRLQSMRLEATKNNKLVSSPLHTAKSKVLQIEKDIQAITATAEEELKRAIETHKRELQAAQERYMRIKRECELYGVAFNAEDPSIETKLNAAKDVAARIERELEEKHRAEQASKAQPTTTPVVVTPPPAPPAANECNVTINFCANEGHAQMLVTRIQQMLKDAGASGCFNVIFEIKDNEQPAF